MQNYRRLLVWQKAHAIALDVHHLTKRIPRGQNSGLVSQLRRASLSIPANIAQGCSRTTDRDFAYSLQVALASASEVEYHLEFAAGASILARTEVTLRQGALIEIRRMLTGLIKHLRRPAS